MAEIRPLAWGRHYLMCRPEHFRVAYAINPWMDPETAVDHDRALAQWDHLAATIERAGARIDLIPQLPEAPDMVYAMNYGLVDGDRVVITNFRHAQRRAEVPMALSWLAEAGLRVTQMETAGAFEAGDAFVFGDRLVVADGPRTDASTHGLLALELGVRVASVRVVHPALYHLDLSFCPLDETRAIVAPSAFDAVGRATLGDLVPEALVIDEQEAFTFCANSVVVGDVVVMPAGTPVRIARQLERWGFAVELVDVTELHKGGGSIRCMTLPLDTEFDAARAVAYEPAA